MLPLPQYTYYSTASINYHPKVLFRVRILKDIGVSVLLVNRSSIDTQRRRSLQRRCRYRLNKASRRLYCHPG